jgi:hypothetical protein
MGEGIEMPLSLTYKGGEGGQQAILAEAMAGTMPLRHEMASSRVASFVHLFNPLELLHALTLPVRYDQTNRTTRPSAP